MPEPLAPGRPPRLRRAGWLAGLPALALIWASATLYAAPRIAERIEAAGTPVAADTATATGEPWLRLETRGRDLAAAGEAPEDGTRAAVLARLAALEGPRHIVSEIGLVEQAAPFRWAAIRTGPDRVALEGSRPVEIGRRALETRIAGVLSPGTGLDDTARAARGAPPDFAQAAAFLAARLSGLARGGRAELTDTVLGISGEAVTVSAYEALRAALSNPPDGFSVGRVEVLPPMVAQYRFAVEKTARGIVLDGFAPTGPDREAALRAATVAAAGGSVEDRLLAARGLDPAIDPKSLIAFAFRLADLIQSGRVAFQDGAIAVTGDAIDGQAIPEAEALMRDARPAGVRPGAVALTARPLAPYRVTIRRTAEAVTLTGHLPDSATRERVLDGLRPRLFREPVIDRTRLADGAPARLGDALAAALPFVVGLADGAVAVSDRSLSLTGESLYRESAARAPERLAAALPPGWTGQAAVSTRQPAETRDPDTCRSAFAGTVAGADLRFPAGGATLAPSFYRSLDGLAALAKACPSLRIAVSGPSDPAKAKASPAAGEGVPPTPAAAPGPQAVAKDAGKDAGKDATQDASKDGSKGAPRKEPARAEAAKPKPTLKPAPKVPPKKAPESPEEPPPDLARLRAQVIVEYLLQAGARPEQVTAGPDAPAGAVAFALQP